jgi:putative oxidoreductase
MTDFQAEWQPRLLSVLRIIVGLMFIEHGLSKLFGFPVASPAHLTLLGGAAGVIEALGGLLVTLGLFTRVAAFIMSGEMAVGYFMVHAPKSFFPMINGGDAAILYCFIFLYIFVAGPGVWALDRLRETGAAGRAGAVRA